MLIAPLPGGDLIDILEGPGKMQLIGIPHHVSDIGDGQVREQQKLGGLGHAVGDEEFLGSFAHALMKYFPEVAAVESAGRRNILHGNIILKILFDEGESLLDIKIPQAVSHARLN